MDITHKFDQSCPKAELRELTLMNGEWTHFDGQTTSALGELNAVLFYHGQQPDVTLVKGNAQLEQALAIYNAKLTAAECILSAIGWDKYSALRNQLGTAATNYARASAYGYPQAEAVKLDAAEGALAKAAKKHPSAALYAKADNYEQSSNYTKSALGTAAKEAIKCGATPANIITKMESDWASEAAAASLRS